MREKRGTRVHRHDLRYVWAKERDTSHHDHYHVRLFLNANAYRTLGRLDKDDGNLSVRLLKAWATALRLYPEDVEGLVHMEGNRILRRGNSDQLSDFFEWCSYMCKANSKNYGRNGKSFGYSQN